MSTYRFVTYRLSLPHTLSVGFCEATRVACEAILAKRLTDATGFEHTTRVVFTTDDPGFAWLKVDHGASHGLRSRKRLEAADKAGQELARIINDSLKAVQ